ncbi:Hsp20/alpha crystallin family protein [Candidatus Uhrbacteria bacterium]|nr:Hsp20/alpha crystallin family protein [Candidatus Uhrbacteria bacterium]
MNSKKPLSISTGETSFYPAVSEEEGQLSVDVIETAKEIIVKSTIAGVKPENLQIQLTSDMLTIRGSRPKDEELPNARYYTNECYWGKFSRSIILPQHVHANRVKATLAHGLLTIRLPKSAGDIAVPLSVIK